MSNGMLFLMNLLVSGMLAALVLPLLLLIRHDAHSRGKEGFSHGFLASPLRKMLLLRGLSPDFYRGVTSPGSRDLHLAICRGCTRRRECDAALQLGGASNFDFCANGTMIERLLREQALCSPSR